MKNEILKVLNDNKHYVSDWTDGFTEDDFDELAQKLDALFALRGVGIMFKEKIETEIEELEKDYKKVFSDVKFAHTNIDDWGNKLSFIKGKIEGLKSALN